MIFRMNQAEHKIILGIGFSRSVAGKICDRRTEILEREAGADPKPEDHISDTLSQLPEALLGFLEKSLHPFLLSDVPDNHGDDRRIADPAPVRRDFSYNDNAVLPHEFFLRGWELGAQAHGKIMDTGSDEICIVRVGDIEDGSADQFLRPGVSEKRSRGLVEIEEFSVLVEGNCKGRKFGKDSISFRNLRDVILV
jgi:hypothetical protein